MFEHFSKHVVTYREENLRIRQYFQECIPTINDNNLYMLRKVCMYISMVYFVMVGVAKLLLVGFKLTTAYLLIIPLIFIYFHINLYTMKHRGEISTGKTAAICCTFYFFLGVILGIIDVYVTPAGQAVWLPIAIMALPMIFIDRIYKYALEELVVLTIMLIQSYIHNPLEHFLRDAYICCAAYFISLLAARIILEMRASEALAMGEVTRLSSLDKLTHVLNKGALISRIENYFNTKSDEESCAMIVIDIDDFKFVNDNLGHHTGDLLLEKVGQLLNDNFRAYDIIGRYGGDEFVVVMPRMGDLNTLETRCKALQMFISEVNFGNIQPFTVSIGGILCKGVTDHKKIFAMADDALYKSKIQGKNNVTTWLYDDTIRDKTILICLSADKHPGIQLLKNGEGERMDIIVTNNDEEAIKILSQYHDKVGLLCVELDDVTNLGVFLMKYVKTRESFAATSVLAVVDTDSEEALAKELKADAVLHFSDEERKFRDAVERLVRV